jgi:hypothetical protein
MDNYTIPLNEGLDRCADPSRRPDFSVVERPPSVRLSSTVEENRPSLSLDN